MPASAVAFAGLLALFGITVLTEAVTRNPALMPGLIVLGAFVVPVSFVALVRELLPGAQVPPATVATCFLSGGVLGTAAASLLEYGTRHELEVPHALLVGGLEEPAKLVIPLLLFAVSGYRRTADGLIVGVAAGMGFAAFETMGYAAGPLLGAHVNVGASESTLALRGVLAPSGHAAWTGLVCAALWWTRGRTGGARVVAPAALLIAILLHGAWDGFAAPLAQTPVAVTSLALLVGSLVLARRELRSSDAPLDLRLGPQAKMSTTGRRQRPAEA